MSLDLILLLLPLLLLLSYVRPPPLLLLWPAPGEPSAGCRRLLAACTRLVGGRKECYSVKAPAADTQIAIVPDRL